MLENKTALVFAATGAIAGEVARTFAAHGATVYASGRDQAALDALKAEVAGSGGKIEVEAVDATSEDEVAAYVGRVAEQAGSIDVVFNGIGGLAGRPQVSGGHRDALAPGLHGAPGEDPRLDVCDLQGRGGGDGRAGERLDREPVRIAERRPDPLHGCAQRHLWRDRGDDPLARRRVEPRRSEGQLAVRGDAMPETSTIQETMAGTARVLGIDPSEMPPPPDTPLGRPISVAETAATATFLASDLSSGTTAQVVDVGGRAMPG